MPNDEKKPAWKNIIDSFKKENTLKTNENLTQKLPEKFDINKKDSKNNMNGYLTTKNIKSSEKEKGGIVEPILKTKITVQIKEDNNVHIKPTSKNLSLVLSSFPAQKVVYNVKTKNWEVKLDFYSKIVPELKRYFKFTDIPKGVITTLLREIAKEEELSDIKLEDSIYLTLLPFQREGLKRAILKNGRILLADEMGLGKTYQSLAIAHFYKLEWPLLILSPASLVDQWRISVTRLLNESSTIVRKTSDIGDMINIISYDIATKNHQVLTNHNFKVIIADECHYLKNPQAKRTAFLLSILQNSTRLIMLSGTPALSRPIELFNVIISLNKNIFKSMTEFGYRYCNLKKVGNYFDWKGSSNCDELDYFLRKCLMVRRLKDDVLNELPKKFRRHVVIDPKKKIIMKKTENHNKNEKNIYLNENSNYSDSIYEFSSDFESTYKGNNNRNIGSNESITERYQETLVKNLEHSLKNNNTGDIEVNDTLMQKYQEAAEIKLEPVKDYLKTLINRNIKFVVFAHHKIMMDGLEEFLDNTTKFIKIDGRTPTNSRQKLVNKFQEEEDVRVALLSLTACSSGLTLTEGKAVIFAELYWNPGLLLQAEDRIHRIGQKDTVNIHYLTALGTVDEIVWPTLLKKLSVLEKLGVGNNELKGMEKTNAKQKDIEDFFQKNAYD